MRYRPEIDGLRTLAVLPVILFHLGYGFISGGYYGVDVFFVISGYLITKILTQSIEENRFSMVDFWIRRVKRLLPALLFVILTTLIVTPFLIFKPIIKEICTDVFPAILSYFNFHALYNFGNYWGGKSNNSFFLHVWSLSVEEQFYLLYPFFLLFSYKWFKNFFYPILVITVCSFLFFVIYLSINKDFTFYMLPTRIWELSIGGLISLISIEKIKNTFWPAILSLAGIALVVLSYFFSDKTISNYALLPVIGASAIILFASPMNITGKILSTKFFVLIGKLSYSMYLWHWTIIVLFKNMDYQLHHVNRHVISASIFILTVLLSYLTFAFIENKTRSYRHTPKIVLVGITVIGVFTIYVANYFSIYYKSDCNKLTDYFRYYDISPTQVVPKKDNPIDYDMHMPNRLEKFSEAYKNEGIITRVNNKSPELILFGDSHGVMWAKLFDEILDELKLSRTFYTSTASNPFFDIENVGSQFKTACYTKVQRIDYAKSITENIEKWNPKLFVIVCRWEGIKDKDKKNLEELLVFLEKREIKIIILTQPPRLGFMENKNACQYFTYLKINPILDFGYVDLYNNESVTLGNNYLSSLKQKYPFVSVYDVFNKMTDDNKVKILMNRDVLYYDDDHLSYPGTLLSKKEIKKIIVENI